MIISVLMIFIRIFQNSNEDISKLEYGYFKVCVQLGCFLLTLNCMLHYYFWQDHNGLEIDLLLKTANAFDVYEVKSTQTLSGALFKNLKHFIELVAPEEVRPYLIYGGEDRLVRSEVQVLPWKMLEY